MNDLLALRLFLAIADTNSFTRAAQRLGLTPAAASRKLSALEAAVGQRLFQRSTRQVSLTEQGANLRPHAQAVIDALEQADEVMRGAAARPAGRLRISSRAGVGRRLLLPWLAEFRATYPDVTVGLELVHDRGTDLFASGCDVAVTIGQLGDSNLVARRLAETDSHILASPGYLARHGTPRTAEDLAEHACLTMNAISGNAVWRLSRDGQRYDVAIRAPLAIDDADALLALAIADQGVVLLADWFALGAERSGRLVRILDDYQIEPRGTPITALYASRSYVPLKVRAFLDFYAERIARMFDSTWGFAVDEAEVLGLVGE